jgi:hypothetical protein
MVELQHMFSWRGAKLSRGRSLVGLKLNGSYQLLVGDHDMNLLGDKTDIKKIKTNFNRR